MDQHPGPFGTRIGHADREVNDRYTHVMQATHLEAAERVGQAGQGSGSMTGCVPGASIRFVPARRRIADFLVSAAQTSGRVELEPTTGGL